MAMPKPMGDESQAMRDAVDVRWGIYEAIKSSGEDDPRHRLSGFAMVAERQMWHLECCVQALIEEIRAAKKAVQCIPMPLPPITKTVAEALEDHARGQAERLVDSDKLNQPYYTCGVCGGRCSLNGMRVVDGMAVCLKCYKQPSSRDQENGPPCPQCGVAWGCWCEHRMGFPVPKVVPGNGPKLNPGDTVECPICHRMYVPIGVHHGQT